MTTTPTALAAYVTIPGGSGFGPMYVSTAFLERKAAGK